jgi:hypothetical protein
VVTVGLRPELAERLVVIFGSSPDGDPHVALP